MRVTTAVCTNNDADEDVAERRDPMTNGLWAAEYQRFAAPENERNGWNEKDDGGQVVQPKAEETASEVSEGDWVWQYPAPASP